MLYWVKNTSSFGKQAIYLDERADSDTNGTALATAVDSLASIKAQGVNIVAPSVRRTRATPLTRQIWQLLNVTTASNSSSTGSTTLKLVPSGYAERAKAVGLDVITWSLERSAPPLSNGSTYYFSSITSYIKNEGVIFEALDVLAQDVGAIGVFSDWSGTTA